MDRLNIPGRTFIYVDTLRLARQKMKEIKWHKLAILKKYLKLNYDSHLAEDDCYVCHEVYKYCRGLTTNQEEFSTFTDDKSEILELNNATLIKQPKLDLLIEKAKHCEDERNLDDAIKLYEKCIVVQCKNTEPYD